MILKQRKLRKIEDEVWRLVPESGNRYQVSNYGRVKSFAFNKKDGQVLKCADINGYKLVQLNMDKIKRKVYVHKLVAEIWLPKPSDKHTYVTHLDGNFKNNQVSNLEWHTRKSLAEKHRELSSQKYGGSQNSKLIRNSKLEESDIMLLKSMLERGVVQSKIAKLFRISEMQVTRIKRGENWGHVQALKMED
ncbi:MAG: NUMOD4 motif-containing HNH endonuclease [Bacteroidales bacterium]|nr:NUMOD4 motif-containing HNH endonuclease [Bacteroidales bacterium]